MGWSHDVTLPIGVPPEWPPVCVRCHAADPPGTFRVRGSRVGWDQILTLSWAVGSRPVIEAPACIECARLLRRERRIAGIASWLMCIPLAAMGFWLVHLLGYLQGPYRRWWGLLGAMICCLPVIIWEALHPRTFDVTVRHGKIDYEFRDKVYAAMFACANNASVW